MCESLKLFTEPTRAWFAHAFGEPTEAQNQAWPAIGSGANTLVIAPTGSGKTLAAFLYAIDGLMTAGACGRRGVKVLYVSPLKALAVDVAKNLERPLKGVAAQCEAQGVPAPAITIATRSGDTTAQERRRIATHPPDILVTTPESLYLMLTSKAGRVLSTVETVIVDEIHAVAGTKRGAHLAVSLERLESLIAASSRHEGDSLADSAVEPAVDSAVASAVVSAVDSAVEPTVELTAESAADSAAGSAAVYTASHGGGHHLQRIGLSATVNPAQEAARFLAGGRPVTIVNPGGRPAMDVRVVEPLENMRDLQSANAQQRVGGVEAQRHTSPQISGVTPAMQRLAERRGLAELGSDAVVHGVAYSTENRTEESTAYSTKGSAAKTTADPAADSSAIIGTAGDRTSGSIWPIVERSVLDEIMAHHTTLVFVNSRGVAEKLTARLNDLYAQSRGECVEHASPEGREGFATHYDAVVGSSTMLVGSHEGEDVIAMAHHGSVSKDRRKHIEEQLKRGELRCVVATSSLELGIDMGSVDLVIQIDTPLSVSSGLQRVGRADHQVGGVSHALFYPLTRQQIVTGTASVEAMLAGDIEALAVPRNPLDILAQQTVAAAAMHDLDADDWYAAVRRSAPFSTLPRDMFDAVIGMMSGEYDTEEFSAFRPRLVWNRQNNLISARPGAQRVAVTSGGTIPDRGLYTVVLPEADAGKGQRRVGELDEEMVYESRVGDVITLGTSTWQIQEITRDRVMVVPAPGRTARLPFWHGEGVGRDYGFSCAIGRFLREIEQGITQEDPSHQPRFASSIERRLHADGLEDNAITNLARLIGEQQASTGSVPNDRNLVVERTPDEDGGWRIVLLSPFGRRVHEPWAMAISHRLNQRYGFDAQAYAADDGIVIQLPEGDGDIPPRDLFVFDPDDLAVDVERQVGQSVLFSARFRECAARSLFMPRSDPGRRVPLWQQRLRAAQLLQAARMHRNFPLLLETARECLQDVYDMPALRQVMTGLGQGTITLKDVQTETPSPFAENILFGFVGAVMYQYDQPQAERSAQLLSVDTQVLERLLGTTDMSQVLDAEVIHDVEHELGERTFWNELAVDDVNGRVTRYAKTHGPFTADRMAQDLHLDAEAAVHALDGLCAKGEVLEGRFVESDALQWLHRDVFRRIRSRSLAKARKAVTPVAPEVFQMFLLDSQGVGPVGGERYEGADGLMRVIEQLEGVALPAALWESSVFPARVRDYQPGLLDGLLTAGEVVWTGSKTGGTGALEPGDIAFHPADSILLEKPEYHAGRDVEASTMPGAIEDALASGGAFHARQLADIAKHVWDRTAEPDIDPQTGEITFRQWGEHQFKEALWSLVWQGMVTNSSFAPVRALMASATGGAGARSGGGARSGAGGAGGAGVRGAGGVGARTTVASSRRRGRVTPVRRTHTDMALGGLWSAVAGPSGGDMSVESGGTNADVYAIDMGQGAVGRGFVEQGQGAQGQGSMDQGAQAERLLAVIDSLLDRYGIIAQPLVDKENIAGGYSALYPVLARLEEHGRLVRGMFVRGFGAAQFADSGTVDALRHPLEQHGRSVVALSVLDPANLSGSAIAWPSVTTSAGKPTRRAGATVVLGEHGAVLYAAVKSRHLTVFERLADNEEPLRKACTELAYALRRANRDAIIFADVNGVPLNARHPFARVLHQAGFTPVPQGMRLY